MAFVDSHFHLDDFEAEGLTDSLIRSAVEAGVTRLVAIGGRDSANELAVRVAGNHPGCVFACVGYDRDVAEGWDGDVSRVRALLKRPEVVATGESGLDYHYHADSATEQKRLFASMLECAAEAGKPIVVHSREADDDTLALLRDYRAAWTQDRPPGVLHCFTGARNFAEQLVELGFLISFSGIVTFKNAQDLRETAAALPLTSLLIETDAPYLAPVPHRGKRNEPAFVPHVAECLAAERAADLSEIEQVTSANAVRLFGC